MRENNRVINVVSVYEENVDVFLECKADFLRIISEN